MTEVLGCDGFNILQNNHEVAGQTVFHFHMHLIPRYQNAKNNDILMWSHENFSDEEMAQIRDSLSPELETEHGFGLETIIQGTATISIDLFGMISNIIRITS